ncbi:MAG: hypothetical protein IJ786_00805 [Bacteroidaceae bacterium]|nr:hypothetical protein [Bacteroidaceae bacterium]
MKKAFYIVLATASLSLAACGGKTDSTQATGDSTLTDTLQNAEVVRIDSLTGDTIYEEDAPEGVATSKEDNEIAPPPRR